MTVEERIAQAFARMRLIWALFMVVSIVVGFFWFPLWAVAFLIPYGFITYFVGLTITYTYLSSAFEKEESSIEEARLKLLTLQERLLAEPIEPEEIQKLLDEAGLPGVSPIEAVSPDQIGTLNGRPIYEWVELHDPNTGKKERFEYYGPISIAGFPEIAGKIFANVDEVLYVRDRDAS